MRKTREWNNVGEDNKLHGTVKVKSGKTPGGRTYNSALYKDEKGKRVGTVTNVMGRGKSGEYTKKTGNVPGMTTQRENGKSVQKWGESPKTIKKGPTKAVGTKKAK